MFRESYRAAAYAKYACHSQPPDSTNAHDCLFFSAMKYELNLCCIEKQNLGFSNKGISNITWVLHPIFIIIYQEAKPRGRSEISDNRLLM